MKTGETALEFLLSLRPALPFSTSQACTPASNSEVRRWLKNQSVVVNGHRVSPEEELDFPITQLVIFPKGARRCTLF